MSENNVYIDPEITKLGFSLTLGRKAYDVEYNKIITNRSGLGTKYDLFVPDLNTAINFNRTISHNDDLINKKAHQEQTLFSISNGIRLIQIFEHEYLDYDKKLKIEMLLNRIFYPDDNSVIYGRNTFIVDNISADKSKTFIDYNHIQGNTTASIRIALAFNNEIVGIMTFNKPRFSGECEYELIRLAWKDNTVIIGGAEKLFNYFIKTYNPESIVSYCDISKFSGGVYKRLGFKLDSVTDPNYVWVNQELNAVLPRYKTMKHKLLASGWGTSDQTENEIMKSHDFLKVYDSGNYKFIWTR